MTTLEWNQDVGITSADIPDSTEKIIFGYKFNKPIDENILPESLEHIVFGQNFNHEIRENVLPKSLISIVFGRAFDRPVDAMVLPDSIEKISVGKKFPINTIIDRLPSSLKYLCISEIDMLEPLNSISRGMYFSIIYEFNLHRLINIEYPLLYYCCLYRTAGYEKIGQKIINGKSFDVIINPLSYVPVKKNKSARN